jgi:hypothetical protein
VLATLNATITSYIITLHSSWYDGDRLTIERGWLKVGLHTVVESASAATARMLGDGYAFGEPATSHYY